MILPPGSGKENRMVSIVTPVYNAEKYIKETIKSVIEQSYTDWELLLVDDCSTDRSCEIIRQYGDPRIRLIKQEENGGAARARNRGIDEAKGRYIAFLDADDIWYADKLECQMQFIKRQDAGFVFTSYYFGDENAERTGKMVRVPKKLVYSEALSRTVIFTSTVLIDTMKIGKPHMPEISSEDTATWWDILRSGVTAYGLDQPLVIYRRPASSLSSDKKAAVGRIWNLYKREGLSFPHAASCLVRWAFRATVRRFVDDALRAHFEAIKRFTVLQLSIAGLVLQTAIYAAFWFRYLYPELSKVRYSREGYNLGRGLVLYFRGHLLILLIYFVMLVFFSQTTGGMKTGYLKPKNVFGSEVTALLMTNILTYFELSLMKNWLLEPRYLVLVFLCQVALAYIWSFAGSAIYRKVFPPRETLVLNYSDYNIAEKFSTRSDRFEIVKVMNRPGLEKAEQECKRWYGCVVVCGGTEVERRILLEFCYKEFIRVYLVPEIEDILIQGSEQMDLFDTPIFELKEYTIRWELRLVKRMIDILVGIICLPFGLYGRKHPVVCIGKDKKEFVRYGRGFYNLLNGTMSLIGPEALEAETAREQMKKDERAIYRYRIKPGITGYAKLYRTRNTTREEQLKMDLYYIQHYSLLFDFKLMLLALQSKAQ